MKVKWSDFAQDEFFKTADYINGHFGVKARNEFVSKVRRIDTLLKTQPLLGVAEPFLEKAPLPFRSVKVSDINRIIYYVGEKYIEVVDFWDMRRNPELLAARVLSHT
ncbi:MAG: type II toxin-antitoxin system RelE/ParE family toxin [Bacteroidales bacterium]|nr:type II toxin-antitoxin system RelE/ParE family toxin [Bacteroidales bacterium]